MKKGHKLFLGMTLGVSLMSSFSVNAFADTIIEGNKEHTLYNTAIFESADDSQSNCSMDTRKNKVSSEVSLKSNASEFQLADRWYATGWVNVVDDQYFPVEHYTTVNVMEISAGEGSMVLATSGRKWGTGKVSATSSNSSEWGQARIYYGW